MRVRTAVTLAVLVSAVLAPTATAGTGTAPGSTAQRPAGPAVDAPRQVFGPGTRLAVVSEAVTSPRASALAGAADPAGWRSLLRALEQQVSPPSDRSLHSSGGDTTADAGDASAATAPDETARQYGSPVGPLDEDDVDDVVVSRWGTVDGLPAPLGTSAHSGADGSRLWALPGSLSHLGGDVTGDGLTDFTSATTDDLSQFGSRTCDGGFCTTQDGYEARVAWTTRSGRDGSATSSWSGIYRNARTSTSGSTTTATGGTRRQEYAYAYELPFPPQAVPSIDGDGVPDVLHHSMALSGSVQVRVDTDAAVRVVETTSQTLRGSEVLDVVSGRTGEVLSSLRYPAGDTYRLSEVLPDLTGDGHHDLLQYRVRATDGSVRTECLDARAVLPAAPVDRRCRTSGSESQLSTEVVVVDGRTGTTLWTTPDTVRGVAVLGSDLDGDGAPEFTIDTEEAGGTASRVYSGRLGRPLWEAQLPGSVVTTGPLDTVPGDDLLVVALPVDGVVVSRVAGRSGEVLSSVERRYGTPAAPLAFTVQRQPDVDGDGVDEVLHTSSRGHFGGERQSTGVVLGSRADRPLVDVLGPAGLQSWRDLDGDGRGDLVEQRLDEEGAVVLAARSSRTVDAPEVWRVALPTTSVTIQPTRRGADEDILISTGGRQPVRYLDSRTGDPRWTCC